MKKLTILITLIATMQLVMAQAPPQLNYQAVVRNLQGQPLINTLVNFQFQIHDVTPAGTVVFTETDTATTNQFGLATVQIGSSSSLTAVSWGSGNKYLQVGVDVTGGTNFASMGTSQLLSVPYALYSGGGSGWGLSGNTGTTYGTNFIGTIDSVNLMFKVKDTVAGRIETYPLANTSLGIGSLKVNTGTYNSAFGASALARNTTGNYNTAIGQAALVFNTTGSNNTAVGVDALNENIAGNSNTAVGRLALFKDTASYNTAFGATALYSNYGGNANTAVGSQALFANNIGNSNTAVGNLALHKDTASNNTALGAAAMYLNVGGVNNTAVGYEALFANTTGTNNTAEGYFSLDDNTTGYSNVAIGTSALYSNTTLSNQVAVGDSALYNLSGGNGDNTAIGSKALFANTTGYNNTAVGYNSLMANTTGYGNIAVGYQALTVSTTGCTNVAVGGRALASNTLGTSNSALGVLSMFNNTTGLGNAALGTNALVVNITGSYNTALGMMADVVADNLSNATAVGYSAKVDSNNKVIIGNTSVVSIGGQVHWTTFSDERVKTNITQNVPGLSFINLLQPVTYHYDINKENELLGIQDKGVEWPGKHDIEKIAFSGFIAQQVDVAAKNSGYNFSGVDKHGNIWGLRYSEFVPSIVKSVQELNAQNQDLLKRVDLQQQQIDELKKQIELLLKK